MSSSSTVVVGVASLQQRPNSRDVTGSRYEVHHHALDESPPLPGAAAHSRSSSGGGGGNIEQIEMIDAAELPSSRGANGSPIVNGDKQGVQPHFSPREIGESIEPTQHGQRSASSSASRQSLVLISAGKEAPSSRSAAEWLEFFRGDCAELSDLLYQGYRSEPLKYGWLLALDICMRGFSQVYLLSNPVAGLLMFIGLCISSSPWHAFYGLLGTMCSNLGGIFAFGWHVHPDVRFGLFGYDGVLIGAGASTFLHPAEMHDEVWKGLILVILCGFGGGVLRKALKQLMTPFGIPGFTLVFNFVTMMLNFSVRNGNINIRPAPAGDLTKIAPPDMNSGWFWVDTVLLSTGQLIFADTWGASAFVCAAMIWVNVPIGCAGVGGGFFASLAIMFFRGGVIPDAMLSKIRFGLFGYHSAATVVVALTIMQAPSMPHRIMSAVFGALLAAYLADSVSAMTTLPILTIPFVLSSWIIVLAQVAPPPPPPPHPPSPRPPTPLAQQAEKS